MSTPIAYGIDFGTTNSLVSVAYPDRVDLVQLPTEPDPEVMRSVVFLHRDDIRIAGERAVQQYNHLGSARTACSGCDLASFTGVGVESPCHHARVGGGCHDARLITELKACLGEPSPGSTHSWGTDHSWSELVAIILRSLKQAADRAVGADVRRAVVGHPAAFAGVEGPHYAERQGMALDRLIQAVELSGFEEVVLLEEPAAAVTAEQEEGLIVALDFGGGTFDVAVLEMDANAGRVLALQGAAIGGEDFDSMIFREWIEEQLGLVAEVPNWLSSRMGRRGRALRLIQEPEVRALLKDLKYELAGSGIEQLENVLYSGFTYDLYREVERAKVALSRDEKATISFQRPGVEVHAGISRADFESLIEPNLERIEQQVGLALDQAGVAPEEVDVVVRTGGSASIPAFHRRMSSMFGPEKVQERPAYSTIATGLGVHALEVWS